MRSAAAWPKHIVIGVDFSQFSIAALRLGVELAERLGVTMSIIHVIPPVAGASPLSGTVSLPASGEELTRAENHLVTFIRRVIGRAPMPEYRIVQSNATDGLLFAARYERAGLIIVGTRGSGQKNRLTLGSIAEQVLSRSEVPVMTVAPRRGRKGSSHGIRRILCPVDFSAAAARALDIAVLVGSSVKAEVVALEIVDGQATDAAVKRETNRVRHWVKAQLSRVGRVSSMVMKGDPADQILDYAKKHEIDLIVVGAKRERLSATTVFGTTAEGVTRRAPCAVLTVTFDQGRRSRPSSL